MCAINFFLLINNIPSKYFVECVIYKLRQQKYIPSKIRTTPRMLDLLIDAGGRQIVKDCRLNNSETEKSTKISWIQGSGTKWWPRDQNTHHMTSILNNDHQLFTILSSYHMTQMIFYIIFFVRVLIEERRQTIAEIPLAWNVEMEMALVAIYHRSMCIAVFKQKLTCFYQRCSFISTCENPRILTVTTLI